MEGKWLSLTDDFDTHIVAMDVTVRGPTDFAEVVRGWVIEGGDQGRVDDFLVCPLER